jgi:hypothetical protein
VGLVSYGNQGYSADAGWVRVDSDLSTDLDTLYSKLFALRTNGGDEYVARAVRDATRQLSWDQRSDTLKILFVAGNEPANQDPQVSLASALGEARQRGILVNTIYCGSTSATESAGWREVASLGHGEFAAIDQSRSVVEVAAPQDTELARLGRELNRTYLSYGADGGARAANQAAQDENAIAASPQAAAGRAVAKASSVYRNESWDVVDARKVKGSFLKDAPAAALPAPMRSMSAPEREAFVDKLESERTRIQARIQELSKERAKYLDAQAKQRSAGAAAADDALLAPLKKEAEKAGYAF